ncbi:hypothetical protein GCM10017771_53370 [Streptomyces capitiformicae]|uniref:Uncharacterized protein n=1 Tax=Streptomyces capitiformicae TaxID=2014920 RepID=A0A918Z3M0_9ACTN|nr:hypothetical protein GCM10017771_53370 [Streptomyces capitiformicae]
MKYSAYRLAMNIGIVNAGCVTIRMYQLCSSISNSSRGPLRPFPATGNARSANVIGAPSNNMIGANMLITMCCTMCTLNMTMP